MEALGWGAWARSLPAHSLGARHHSFLSHTGPREPGATPPWRRAQAHRGEQRPLTVRPGQPRSRGPAPRSLLGPLTASVCSDAAGSHSCDCDRGRACGEVLRAGHKPPVSTCSWMWGSLPAPTGGSRPPAFPELHAAAPGACFPACRAAPRQPHPRPPPRGPPPPWAPRLLVSPPRQAAPRSNGGPERLWAGEGRRPPCWSGDHAGLAACARGLLLCLRGGRWSLDGFVGPAAGVLSPAAPLPHPRCSGCGRDAGLWFTIAGPPDARAPVPPPWGVEAHCYWGRAGQGPWGPGSGAGGSAGLRLLLCIPQQASVPRAQSPPSGPPDPDASTARGSVASPGRSWETPARCPGTGWGWGRPAGRAGAQLRGLPWAGDAPSQAPQLGLQGGPQRGERAAQDRGWPPPRSSHPCSSFSPPASSPRQASFSLSGGAGPAETLRPWGCALDASRPPPLDGLPGNSAEVSGQDPGMS